LIKTKNNFDNNFVITLKNRLSVGELTVDCCTSNFITYFINTCNLNDRATNPFPLATSIHADKATYGAWYSTNVFCTCEPCLLDFSGKAWHPGSPLSGYNAIGNPDFTHAIVDLNTRNPQPIIRKEQIAGHANDDMMDAVLVKIPAQDLHLLRAFGSNDDIRDATDLPTAYI